MEKKQSIFTRMMIQIRQNRLRWHLTALLIILLITVLASTSITVFSSAVNNERTQAIVDQEMPQAISALYMLDQVNAMRASLRAYLIGDDDAKTEFLEKSVEFRSALEIQKRSVTDNDIFFIELLFNNLEKEAEQKIFARFDAAAYESSIIAARKLRTEVGEKIEQIIQEMLLLEHQNFEQSAARSQVTRQDLNRTTYLLNLQFSIGQMLSALDQFALQDETASRSFFDSALSAQNHIVLLRDILRDTGEDLQLNRVQEVRRLLEELQIEGEAVLASQNALARARAISAVENFEQVYFQRLADVLHRISARASDNVADRITLLNTDLSRTNIIVLSSAALSLIMILLISWRTIALVLRPLSEMSRIHLQLGKGQYDNTFPEIQRRDEVGRIFRSLHRLQDALREHEEWRAQQMQQVEAQHIRELERANAELTEREMTLRTQTEKLRGANHELEQFVYIASHDLREPLKNMLGYASILKMDKTSNFSKRTADAIEHIHSSGRRLSTLIDDLRSLTKLQSVEITPKPCNIKRLTDQIIANKIELLQKRKILLNISNLPEMEVSELHVLHLFDLLFDNAIAHGSVPLHLSLSATQRKTSKGKEVTVFSFSNSVESAFIRTDRMFLPFWRGSNSSRKFTGIGLAIVKKIVEDLHKGRVWVTLSETRDFTVNFTLEPTPYEVVPEENRLKREAESSEIEGELRKKAIADNEFGRESQIQDNPNLPKPD